MKQSTTVPVKYITTTWLQLAFSCTVTYCKLSLTHAHTHALVVPCNHDAFHCDWQELLQGIKARYYLSCPVRMGLTGVTFSLVRQGASIHYPASSELAVGADCCLSLQRLSVPFYVCYTLTRKNESMQSCTWELHLVRHHVCAQIHTGCLVSICLVQIALYCCIRSTSIQKHWLNTD